jgi:long-chain fatty acid transport protein
MKKLNLIIIAIVVLTAPVVAGGLVTNTNGSAAWARTLTREASTGVDAVYFNPAGLAKLNNGLSLSVSNQTIFQTRTITSDYPLLNGSPKSYEAELTAPIFPGIYAAFKKDKWAFSAGFNIIGGGGSADFQEGLPSFEIPVSGLVPGLQSSLTPIDQAIESAAGMNPGFANVTGYDMNAAFNGASTYMGFQLGVTYAITDMISVAIGGRYVSAKNTYEGSLTGVTIDAPAAYGGTQIPGDYLRTVGGQLNALAMTPGLNPVVVAMLNGAADQLDQNATGLDQQTGDKALEAVQTGGGFTPIVSVNVNLLDMVNIAAKYEHHTKIELTNETTTDDVGMFPDGEKTRADLPGMFSLGAAVSPIDKLVACVGFNYYLDKPAYYGVTDDAGEQINNETTIDANAYTIAASLQYRLIGPVGLSVGYSFGNLGVNDDYQSDLSYANQSSTIAGGVFVEIGDMLTINAGYVHVMYNDYSEGYDGPPAWTDTYAKKTNIIAIGVDITL